MPRAKEFFNVLKSDPDKIYIVHYSSQSLYDAEAEALSPRITSVVVRHYVSAQTVSFGIHTIAETLGISSDAVEAQYDQIEGSLLTQFYQFARDRRAMVWVHWNMRNITFGFEHLEHRYRVLTKNEPPSIPVEVRHNLNDILKDRYGDDYAPDPRMLSLMQLNGPRVQGFLTGAEEAEAFKAKDFIRMNASTIAKVGFFSFVISRMKEGKLKTASRGLLNLFDRLLESRPARLVVGLAAILGVLVGAIQLVLWIISLASTGAVR